ncbi:putative transporter [Pseudocercospora fuligena]|uniref:Putative transporter n=1 Tax=Pseudocercospora fuligena TaxID=685502 RepID=A0A8H6RGT3_9PEZI|nr:putative transporter [Pseudocercospora fuligena]
MAIERALHEDLESTNGRVTEDTPLLKPPEEESWKPPRSFVWIEIAIFANVFLYGFDGTITASTYAVISSDFDAANTASWLTTSYLVTSTAFQPLYGRFSDIFGRRICFFISTITFATGCFGCGLAQDVISVDLMRALTGLGGGGLMNMATIINSDMIPFRRRGMYQALQNTMFGVGAISGASFGGAIADSIGWRWCFLLQVPISVAAFVLGWLVIKNPHRAQNLGSSLEQVWNKIDFAGSIVLVVALSLQLVGLSIGGNELPWKHPVVVSSLTASVVLLALFFAIEARTTAIPIIPLRMFQRKLSLVIQLTNLCAGTAAYAYLFVLPLFFQVVLLDTAAKAGARLAIPSLATPIGGILAGLVMSRYGRLMPLVRLGAFFMALGNGLVTSLGFYDALWKYYVFIFPANLGQGIIYPSTLFTNLATFEHSDHAVSASTVYLVRSVGSVWGVAITSAIIQTTLKQKLPKALNNVQNRDELINQIRHSVTALKDLPPSLQLPVRLVYYEGLRYAFAVSTCIAGLALIASWFARPGGLRSTK